MLWVPVTAAGVINGIGHWWGYRNYETADASTNIVPFGIIIGGEELHNNHHAFASSAKLSNKWWEFDIGWLYIRTMEILGLAKVKKIAPKPVIIPGKARIDVDSVKGVIGNRMQVMSQYAKNVLDKVYEEELVRVNQTERPLFRRVKTLRGWTGHWITARPCRRFISTRESCRLSGRNAPRAMSGCCSHYRNGAGRPRPAVSGHCRSSPRPCRCIRCTIRPE